MAKFAFRNDDEKRKQRLESLYLAAKQNQQFSLGLPKAKEERQTTSAERPSS